MSIILLFLFEQNILYALPKGIEGIVLGSYFLAKKKILYLEISDVARILPF